MKTFVLLMLDDDIWQTFNEGDQNKWILKYRDWAKANDDVIIKADPINTVGQFISVADGEVIVEPKDYTGDPNHMTGYFIYQAEDWDAAIEFAKGCPTLQYGGRIELRMVGH
jgi:hypothetical protein